MWGVLCFLAAVACCGAVNTTKRGSVDYGKVREDVRMVFQAYPSAQDLPPAVLRLGWHSSATWDPHHTPHGGSNGATMRYEPESGYYKNRGLKIARDALVPVRDMHPGLTFSDLWVLAAYEAVEYMGGPHIDFTPGREDTPREQVTCPPEARLPGWEDSASAMRAHFHRMGLTDREMVALMGAHSVGHTRPENSGFPHYHWDITATKFDNIYYRFLLEQPWQYDEYGDCGGKTCKFYFNRSWIMLLVDWHLRTEEDLVVHVQEFAKDEAKWHDEFARAFKKLTEQGL